MATRLLDDISFSLLRTTPKLSTNVKLVVGSSGDIFLDSFDANEELSKSKFKAFKVDPDSSYDRDLYNFYAQGKFPKQLAYETFQQNDDLSILSDFASQYELMYSSGCEAITSKFFSEELGILAPMWINKVIPELFVVFRIDGPVTVNNKDAITENENGDLAKDPTKFIEHIIAQSTLIKTFDLSEKSNIGKYIRNYVRKPGFPTSSVSLSTRRDESTTWNGISYDEGGFSSKGDFIYDEFVTRDKSILEKDYFITKGLERNGIINANLLNLQFLFDDEDVDEFTVHRYFGLYVNAVDEGTFTLDGQSFFRKAYLEPNQTPAPVGDATITADRQETFVVNNPDGILLHIDESSTDSVTAIPTPEQVSELASFFFIRDKNSEFHNIKTGGNWSTNQLRIADTEIDLNTLTGFGSPLIYADAEILSERGKSLAIFTVAGQIPHGFSITFLDGVTQIAQVAANGALTEPAKADGLFFNPNGTITDVVKSFAEAINNIPQDDRIFEATAQNDQIVIVSRFSGSRFNELKFELNPSVTGAYFTHFPSNGLETSLNFVGGSDTDTSRIKIKREDAPRFTIGRYIKTTTGFAKIVEVTPFIDDVTFDVNNFPANYNGLNDFSTVIVDNAQIPFLNSSKQIPIFEVQPVTFGRFSMFPVKTFDMDTFSTEYSELGELVGERNEYTEEDISGLVGNATHPDVIDFYTKGFGRLEGLLKEDSAEGSAREEIESEYDRLKENFILELANISKVVPYTNKWVFREGKDVRNKDYRLNMSDAFGIYNFSPAKDNFEPDPDAYTHEWYLLSQVPEYFTDEDLKSSWSYFDEKVEDRDITQGFTGNFHDIDTDKFVDYFVVDRLTSPTSGNYVPLDRQVRYSRFDIGSRDRFAETFFRGVKVLIKERTEFNTFIDFNAKDISFVKNSRFNGYKFASILIPHDKDKPTFEIKFVENKKFKTVTMMIFLSVNYPPFDIDREFIDRTMLYALKSKITPDTSSVDFPAAPPFVYSDTQMQGAISIVNSNLISDPYVIKGITNSDGVPTNFVEDIKIGQNGKFNDIEFEITSGSGTGIWEISDIVEVIDENTLLAESFDKLTGIGSPADINSIPVKPSTGNLRASTYIVKNGGFKEFEKRMRFAAFATIYDRVNQGHPDVEYETVELDGSVVTNRYAVELVVPNEVIKPTFLTTIPDADKPTAFNLIDIIGFKVALASNINLTPFFRHSGRYVPKFVDVLMFQDPFLLKGTTSDNALSEYEERVFNEMRFANTAFNIDDENFGVLKNFFFHKVNKDNRSQVLELEPTGGFKSLYPLIDESAIDKKEFYVFNSSWDPAYFINHVTKSRGVDTIGTRSYREKKSFFGSKVMKIRDTIAMNTFEIFPLPAEGVDDPDIVDGTVFFEETDNIIRLKVFIEKRLSEIIFDEILTEFTKFINPNFGFGTEDSLTDDVNEYIRRNIVKRYRIDDIKLFILEDVSEGDTDFSGMSLSDSQKFTAGLEETNSFSTKTIGRNSLDFEITFNKSFGKRAQLGLSIDIIKR